LGIIISKLNTKKSNIGCTLIFLKAKGSNSYKKAKQKRERKDK